MGEDDATKVLRRIHEQHNPRNRSIDIWLREHESERERFIEFCQAFSDLRFSVRPPMAMQSLLDALLADENLGFDLDSLPALRNWIKDEFPSDG